MSNHESQEGQPSDEPNGIVRSPSLLEYLSARRTRKNAQRLSFRVSGRSKMKISFHHTGSSITMRRRGKNTKEKSSKGMRPSRSINSGLSRSSSNPYSPRKTGKKFRVSKEQTSIPRSQSMQQFSIDKIGQGMEMLEADSCRQLQSAKGLSRTQKLLQDRRVESPSYQYHPFFSPEASWNASFTLFVLNRVKNGWIDEADAEFPCDTARVAIKKDGTVLYIIEMHGVTGYSSALMTGVPRAQALQFLNAFEITFAGNYSVRYDAEASVNVAANKTQLSLSSSEDDEEEEEEEDEYSRSDEEESEEMNTGEAVARIRRTLGAIREMSSTSLSTSDPTTSEEEG